MVLLVLDLWVHERSMEGISETRGLGTAAAFWMNLTFSANVGTHQNYLWNTEQWSGWSDSKWSETIQLHSTRRVYSFHYLSRIQWIGITTYSEVVPRYRIKWSGETWTTNDQPATDLCRCTVRSRVRSRYARNTNKYIIGRLWRTRKSNAWSNSYYPGTLP